MAINPYQLANIDILSDIAGREAVQKQREGLAQTGMQKTKLVKRFNKEQEEAMEKFRKKSKGGFFGKLASPWLTSLIGAFNPLAGAIMSGIGTAGTGIMSRKAAKDLPGMEGWKTTFLSKGAKETEDIYKGIQKQAPSLFESLTAGAISGVTAKAMGEGMEGAFKPKGTEGIKIFGKDKAEGKFFERLKQKLRKTKAFDDSEIEKGIFGRMKEGVQEDELLSKDWVKLLKTIPELQEGNLTDFVTQIQGKQAREYKTLADLEADKKRIIKTEGKEAYEEYLKQFEEGK